MRSKSSRAVGLTLVVAGMLLGGVAGCSSNKPSKSISLRDSAVNSLDRVNLDLASVDRQVQTTQASLHALATQKSGDLHPNYKAFSVDVDRTVAWNEKLNTRYNDATNASYEYINTWNYTSANIRDETMRSTSLEEQRKSRGQYDQVVTGMSDLQRAYAQYVHYLQDARSFVAADLTNSGVAKLNGLVPAIDSAAAELQQAIANQDSRVKQLATNWQSTTPEPTPQAVPAGKEMPPQNNNMAPSGEYRSPGDNINTTP